MLRSVLASAGDTSSCTHAGHKRRLWLQVLADQSSGGTSLMGSSTVAVGPAALAAASSYVTGLQAPLTAGTASFAIEPRDAAGNPILEDPQVGLHSAPDCWRCYHPSRACMR